MISTRGINWGLGAMALALTGLLFGCKPADPKPTDGTEPTNTSTSTGETAGGRPESKGDGVTVSGDTIKIGLVASQNGDLRPWGIDSIEGARLAIDEVNAAGGINGKKVQLLVGDSASTPEGGKTAAEKLLADGCIGLIGEVASGITIQMANVAFEKGVPVVAIGATKTTLTDIGNNVFRVCYTDDFQGPVMAKFAYEELGLRKVGLMTDNKQPYSVGLSDAFRAAFTKMGGEIVDEQFYESGQTQFSGQLTNMKAKNPDGIFMSGYFVEVGPMALQIRNVGMKDVKLFGGDGWDSTELTSGGGDAIIGSFFCNHYNNLEDRPEVQNFLSKWKAKMNGSLPGTTMGALGYDAAMLMCDALKRTPDLNSKSLIKAIDETENFNGVSGVITLKGMNGNPPKRALVVQVTREGQAFKKAYEATELN